MTDKPFVTLIEVRYASVTDRIVRYASGRWYWRVCGTEGGRERVILHIGTAIGFYLSVRWRDGRKRLHLFKRWCHL